MSDYKFHPSEQAFIFNPGRHYVIYSDGFFSLLMPKRIARNYAEMFGGTVGIGLQHHIVVALARLWRGLTYDE